MPAKTPARQLILEAAIACIDREGLEHVTTRKIAQQAGTNIASINYYFRSKDELLTSVLEMTIQHMLADVVAAIENEDQSFEATLRSVIFYLVDGGLRFPGITRAHLQLATSGSGESSASSRAMRRVFKRLTDRAIRNYPKRDPSVVRLRLAQVLSSILFVMLTPELFPLPGRYAHRARNKARPLADAYTELFLKSI